ncbi:hypothetical protein ES705_44870 [subsurface metagenome]
MTNMANLKHKSIRTDHEHVLSGVAETIWKWAPDRDIKIKRISVCMDLPHTTGLGTLWEWISIGASDIEAVATHLNEEEQVIQAAGFRSDDTESGKNFEQFIDLGADYIEIDEGEAIYYRINHATGAKSGHSVVIYYI